MAKKPGNTKAIIIGGGPAGLTAAYELATRTDIVPVVLEMSDILGGISRTVHFKGNRIDIGGHRFFSKSDRVMDWWLEMMPIARSSEAPDGPDPDTEDGVMLLRQRRSRIFFNRRLFDYPVSLSPQTLMNLGMVRAARIVVSYLRSVLFPIKDEKSLEDFFINRFGRELYRTFFKSYTEKVWGVPCDEISPEWGAQRVKGLSIFKAAWHFLKQLFGRKSSLAQKEVETSLIEQFLYPKLGPGQMWEEVARRVVEAGGEVVTGCRVVRLEVDGDRVTGVEVADADGAHRSLAADYVFSTMDVRELIRALDTDKPAEVVEVSEGLAYRDFMTVGLLLERLHLGDDGRGAGLIEDNWIYIQEPDVLVGRMQIFNNWSPYLVADPSKAWVGLEYFCYEGDDLWTMADERVVELAVKELELLGFAARDEVIDAAVFRMPKTYPAYFGTYGRFDEVREYLDRFSNLFLVGRNGMHRYNNQDHSMLTAMIAVDNIAEGRQDKANIWAVNVEEEYHEAR
ncbi:MAG: NAD(P)/FAD-dependent oxidoreductase [Candidatus Geothermincolia bacterium]